MQELNSKYKLGDVVYAMQLNPLTYVKGKIVAIIDKKQTKNLECYFYNITTFDSRKRCSHTLFCAEDDVCETEVELMEIATNHLKRFVCNSLARYKLEGN